MNHACKLLCHQRIVSEQPWRLGSRASTIGPACALHVGTRHRVKPLPGASHPRSKHQQTSGVGVYPCWSPIGLLTCIRCGVVGLGSSESDPMSPRICVFSSRKKSLSICADLSCPSSLPIPLCMRAQCRSAWYQQIKEIGIFGFNC